LIKAIKEYQFVNKLEEDSDDLIKQKFNEIKNLLDEYNELTANFEKKSELPNKQLFLTHPELFFSINQLQSLNILSLCHTGIYEKLNNFFYSREKVGTFHTILKT